MISFTAHCARGHDRIDFTDPTEFEKHMGTEHKARKATRNALYNGKPYPWVAPKAPADASALTAVLVAAGSDVSDVSGVPGFVSNGTFRYDREENVPPLDSLPVTLRPVVAGAVARGEMWLVHIDGATARVEVGRKGDAGTEAARIEIREGRIRKVYVKTLDRGHYSESKITDAKALFPAA